MSNNSKDWEEKAIAPNEQELFEGFVREIEEQQRKIAQSTSAPTRRGFHAKLHAGLRAEFEVLADLPADAQHGVFSKPRIFPAMVRFSNGEPSIHPDKHTEPRGIAIKLFEVPGRKLLSGQEDAVTQDFLATSHSVTSTVRDVKQFMAFIRASHNRLTLPFTLARAVGVKEALRILIAFARNVASSKVRSMVTEHYSSTAPIKLGPFAVKFTVRPTEGTRPVVTRPLTDNFLRDELAERLREGDILLDFLVQFFQDETRTPIEDTSVLWKPEDAPPVKVAQVRIPRCDLDNPATHKRSEDVDKLSFTPWHAIEDHRPLGNIMRARKVAYSASAKFRGAAPEPTTPP